MQFWAEDEGLTEVHTEEWEPSLDDADGTRSYDYIKPLNASMGPKSARCELEDSNDYYDAEKVRWLGCLARRRAAVSTASAPCGTPS